MFPFNGQTGLWCIEKAAEKYVEEIRLQWLLYVILNFEISPYFFILMIMFLWNSDILQLLGKLGQFRYSLDSDSVIHPFEQLLGRLHM